MLLKQYNFAYLKVFQSKPLNTILFVKRKMYWHFRDSLIYSGSQKPQATFADNMKWVDLFERKLF